MLINTVGLQVYIPHNAYTLPANNTGLSTYYVYDSEIHLYHAITNPIKSIFFQKNQQNCLLNRNLVTIRYWLTSLVFLCVSLALLYFSV